MRLAGFFRCTCGKVHTHGCLALLRPTCSCGRDLRPIGLASRTKEG